MRCVIWTHKSRTSCKIQFKYVWCPNRKRFLNTHIMVWVF